MTEDDALLIRRAQSGDKDAFARLVQRYYRNIYNLAYRMTGSREDAMDVTQEALYRVYRALNGFQPDKSFLPWVYKITWNICADRGRKKIRSPVQESFDSIEYELARFAGNGPQPEAAYENMELGNILKDAVGKLKEGYRELIVMFHVDGLSIKEISQITGMKETVVKNRLYRGRQMLRQILKEGGFSW